MATQGVVWVVGSSIRERKEQQPRAWEVREKTEKEQSESPSSLSPEAAKGEALQGGPANLGPARGLHRGSGLKIIFSDGSQMAGRVLSTQWASISICGTNDGMKSPPDSGTKGPWGPC